jgi:hypothetical protein
MVHPRTFISDYIAPAIEVWRSQQNAGHLAIHALTQIDILAEVVDLWNHRDNEDGIKRGSASRFREELGKREPSLAIVRDVHDNHKHGRLNRITALVDRRPEMIKKFGFFADHSFYDDDPTPYNIMGITLKDGSDIEVYRLIDQAMEAWERELTGLGL